LLLVMICFAGLTACAKGGSADSAASPAPSATASPSGSAGPAATGTGAPSSLPVATTVAAVAATSAPTVVTTVPAAAVASSSPAPKKVAFSDIAGTLAAKQIVELAQLGVVDPTSGKFRPHDPITRGDYVRWLVRANNAYFGPSQQIRLPEVASNQTFVDVPPSDPNYKYIQGMSDAGLVIGIDAKHFAPNRLLTREELIAIYEGRCSNGGNYSHIAQISDAQLGFKDDSQIAHQYWDAFNYDHWNGGNLQRIFGVVGMFHPRQPVTREEAAISVSVILNGSADAAVQATSGSS
jgi:hypothetical protein